MKYLKQFLLENKLLVTVTAVMIGIQTLVMLYLPYLISVMINEGIMVNNKDVIFSVGLKMVATLVFETIFGLYSCYLASELASRYGRKSRQLIFRKVQRLKVDEVNELGIASLVTRMGADNVNVQQMIVSFFQMVLPGPLIGIAAIYMTYILSPELTLVPLATVIIYIIVVGLILFESLPYIDNVQKRLDKMTKVFREFLMGVKIIRAFDQSKKEKDRVDDAFEGYAQNNIKINILFAALSPVAYTLLLVAMAFVLWIGSSLVAQDLMGIGNIPAVLEYTTMSIGMLIMSSLVLFQLPKTVASLQRIEEVVLREESLHDEGDLNWQAPNKSLTNDLVVFDNVSMSYENDGDPSIENIHLTLKKGRTTAIVGATGSGKTTIVKTLLRLNERDSGRLTVHGKPVEEIPLQALRDMISYVPQRNFLFRGTIRENIAFSDRESSFKAIVNAAKIAQAHEFIMKEPHGFDGRVSQGGTNFSGGQKQRLALARALLKKADVYVFDDSFSALDYATDLKVRQGIKKKLTKAAVLIVAQRLHSIVDADEIVVMDRGRVVGVGNHNQLLQSNSYYRLIAKSQGLLAEEANDGSKK